jgi:hypothetical protein
MMTVSYRFRVLSCLLTYLWITEGYRDGAEGDAIMEAGEDKGDQKATLESMAVGTSSFVRQNSTQHHGDVTVSDVTEEEEPSEKEAAKETKDAREEEREMSKDEEYAELEDEVLRNVVRDEEEKERERREQGSAFVEERPSGGYGGRRREPSVLWCKNIDVRGTGCNGDFGDQRLNHEADFTWQIWRGKGQDQQKLVPLSLMRMLSSAGKGTMTLGLLYMSIHIMAPGGLTVFDKPSYFSYFTAVLFSSTATLALAGLFDHLNMTAPAWQFLMFWGERQLTSPSFNGFEQAAKDTYLERMLRTHVPPTGQKERQEKEKEWEEGAQEYFDRIIAHKQGPREFEDIARMPEVCGEIQFTGPTFGGDHPDGEYLSSIEDRTNLKASRAVVEYCNAMDSGGSSALNPAEALWGQPSIMPKPSVCIENSNPSMKRKMRAPAAPWTGRTSARGRKFFPELGTKEDGSDYWFRCYDILRLANEELMFQTTMTQFHVVKEMVDHLSPKRNTGVCPKKYNVPAPTNMIQQACAEDDEEYLIEKMLNKRAADEANAVSYNSTQDTVDMSSSLLEEEEVLDEDSRELMNDSSAEGWGRRRKESAIQEEMENYEHRRRCWFFCNNKHEDLMDDGRDYADEQGKTFDPEMPYQPPLAASVTPQQKANLIKVIREKDEALHDCLSISSCQLLRKDMDAIQGKSRKWYTLWIGKHQITDHNLFPNIVQRCLGHSELVGPQYQMNCESCPAKMLGGVRNVLHKATFTMWDSRFSKTGVCDVKMNPFSKSTKVKNHNDKRKRSVWSTAKADQPGKR